MEGMLGAIQKRRGGGMLNDDEENAHQPPQEEKQAGGLENLVASLDDAQKQQLLKILVSDQNVKSDAPDIAKGGMGPGEEAELSDAAMEGAEDGDEHESEAQIAESMVGSSDKMRAERGDTPRNLGERVKFDLAKKLNKGKGSY